jgi:hypothetical protein
MCVIWRVAEMKHRRKKIVECHLAPSRNKTKKIGEKLGTKLK